MKNNEIYSYQKEPMDEAALRHETFILYVAFMLTPELYGELIEADKEAISTWFDKNGYVKDGVINPTQAEFREIRRKANEVKGTNGTD